MQKQPTFNLGTLGHVAHGKTSLVEALSSIRTTRISNEKKRGITIRLGYANVKIFKCPKCPRPTCYHSYGSMTQKQEHPLCPNHGCGTPTTLVRHFSFVDCPGHECLMERMLTGAAVMDGAILIIAANAAIPQPQTMEHLAGATLVGLSNIVTVQNKVDLVQMDEAKENHDAILEFIQGTPAEGKPIIPICCSPNSIKTHEFPNLDVLCQYLVERMPLPSRDLQSHPIMLIIRSFDVNHPGTPIIDLKGGVAGGTLLRGILKVGDEIEIRPGLIKQTTDGFYSYHSIFTKIVSLYSDDTSLECAQPGGLIGVGTKLDPTLTMGDRLVGQVIGRRGQLPGVWTKITIKPHMMRNNTNGKINPLSKGEELRIVIWAASGLAKVSKIHSDGHVILSLKRPMCAEIGSKMALVRRFDNVSTTQKGWRLIGFAEIIATM